MNVHPNTGKDFLVDVGGEILAKGRKPNGELWKVGIEKPAENKDSERIVQEIVELHDKSIVTSGNYRKYVEYDLAFADSGRGKYNL